MADPIALARLAALAGGAPAPSARPPLLPVAPPPLRLASPPSAGRPTYAQLRAATPTAAPRKAKPRGLLKQLYDPIVGLPKGAAHIGAALGREIWHSPTVISETFKHGPVQFRALRALHGDEGARQSILRQARLSPLDTELSQSLGRTASDIRHPTNFQRAAREGRIVDKLIEDITNLSVVAAPAAKAVGAGFEAGSLGARVAGGVERAAVLGGETANYPISLGRGGVNFVRETALPRLGELRPSLAEAHPTVFTEAGVEAARGSKLAHKAGVRGEAVLHRIGLKLERGEPGLGAPTPEEQAAAYATVVGQHQMPAALVSRGAQFSPEEMGAILAPSKIEGAHLAPEALAILQEPQGLRAVGGHPVQQLRASGDPWEGLQPGTTRLFRGEHPSVGKGFNSTPDEAGRWWTPDPAMARHYSTGRGDLLGEQGAIYYTDVPINEAGWQMTNLSPGQATRLGLPGEQLAGVHLVAPPGMHAAPLERLAAEQATRPGVPSIGPVPGLLSQLEMLAPDTGLRGARPTVQTLIDKIRQVREAQTAGHVEQGVFTPEQIHEWATSNEMLTDVVDRTQAEMDRAVKAGHPEEAQRIWDETVQDPMSYASRWRPRMAEADRARQSLLARGEDPSAVPYLPSELAAAGVTPEYLPHGRPTSTIPESERLNLRASNVGILGDVRIAAEHRRGLSPEAPMNIADLLERMGSQERVLAERGFARKFINEHGQEAGAVLGPETLNDLDRAAHAEAARRFPGDVTEKGGLRGDARFEYMRLRGDGIRSAMADRGLEAWPTKGFVAGDIPAHEIDATTKFLPAGLRDRVARRWGEPGNLPFGLKQMEAINRKFKGAVLPWSIRWQVGDALSNYLLAWTSGRVNPLELTAAMRDLGKLSSEARELISTHAPAGGLTFGEDLRLRPEERPTPITMASVRENPRAALRHPIKTAQQPGWKLNQALNRVQRQAFTLVRLERLLGKEGMSIEEAATQAHTPRVRKALQDAVKEADDALGAYDDMTPFEKKWMRNVFPFWSWIRTITKVSANLVIDDPIRAAWVMRVGQLGVDPDSQLPDYLRGAINIPGLGGTFDTNFVNPFADPTQQSILTPQGAARALSPAIKLASVAAAGFDLNRLGYLSRPPRSGNLDQFQRPTATPLGLRPLELGYWLTQQTPQTRFLTTAAPRVSLGPVNLGPVARYGQGSQITRGRQHAPIVKSRATEALRLASIPVPTPPSEIAGILATIAKNRRLNG